jgi:replicative DNA helicase
MAAAPNLQPLGPGRMPPCDLDAEAACLSALLLDPNAVLLDEVRAEIGDEAAFYSDANRRVYGAICALADASEKIDAVTVAQRLKADGKLHQAGGAPYIAQLVDATPAYVNVLSHARIVADLWRLRRALAQSQMLAAEIYGGEYGQDVQTFLARAEQEYSDIAYETRKGTLKPIAELLDLTREVVRVAHTEEGRESLAGIPTGFALVDKKTNGLHDGDLIYVAGRPGSGKTAYALAVARAVSARGIAVPIFSLEMPAEQLVLRLISMEAGVDLMRMRSGGMSGPEWSRFTTAVAALYKLALFVDDTPALSVFDIRARTKRLKKEIDNGKYAGVKRLGPPVIDYLQLMGTSGLNPRAPREQHIAAISRELKELAKIVRAPVMALCQLNREVEHRADHRPQLSDLRESGSLEQDADVVQFLYRDEMYAKDSPDKGTAELITAKQRNGPTGMCRLAFTAEYTRFRNLEPMADETYSSVQPALPGAGFDEDYGDDG